MKYSIVLPVKNGGQHIKECVQSILSQTISNFTLHILDNCSTDGTLQWVNALEDDRVIVIPSDRPLTIEENWARILDIDKNEYITLIGHDDILATDYLQIMQDLIIQFPDAGLFQTHFTFIDKEGKTLKQCKPMREKETASEFLASILTNNFDMMGTGFMMRANDYNLLGGIPPYPNLIFADVEIFNELTRISYKITSLKNGFSYRLHQSTTKVSPDVKIHKAFERFIFYLDKLAKQDEQFTMIINNYGKEFLLTNCKALSHRLLRTPIEKRENLTVSKFINQCREYALLLIPHQKFNPLEVTSIRMAAMLDSNSIGRQLFLYFKKIYSRPVLK